MGNCAEEYNFITKEMSYVSMWDLFLVLSESISKVPYVVRTLLLQFNPALLVFISFLQIALNYGFFETFLRFFSNRSVYACRVKE